MKMLGSLLRWVWEYIYYAGPAVTVRLRVVDLAEDETK